MIIAFNHDLKTGYGRRLLSGALEFTAGRTDIELWFAIPSAIAQSPPETIDGIIGAASHLGMRHATRDTAIVNVNSEPRANTIQVCSDNHAITEMAFAHFHARNIRSFAFLKAAGLLSSASRCPSFESVCEEHGFSMFVLPCTNRESISTQNEPLVDALLALPKPTGVLLPQDAVGPSFISLCTALGLRVPDDIAVLGVNNRTSVCQSCEPPLSSIDIAAEKIGFEATRTVVAMIEGKAVAPITTIPPADLVPRESTDLHEHLDPAVMRVLDYMQQNLQEPIEKEDLIRQQTLGRRALEKHFKAAIGEAPMQHLRSLRLQKARHLLETTSLTVEAISRQCGIQDANYLCRMFRKQFGRSPLQHRKQFASI